MGSCLLRVQIRNRADVIFGGPSFQLQLLAALVALGIISSSRIKRHDPPDCLMAEEMLSGLEYESQDENDWTATSDASILYLSRPVEEAIVLVILPMGLTSLFQLSNSAD